MATQRKAQLFIYGLHWTVGPRKLRDYFMKFGPVELCQVKYDFGSGFSKGYGFLEFKNQEDAAKILSEPHHTIVRPFMVRKSVYEPGEDLKAED